MKYKELLHLVRDNKDGSVIVIALIAATLLVTASLSITTVALSNLSGSKGLANAARAFYAAESGIELSLLQLAGHKAGFEASDSFSFPEEAAVDYTLKQRSAIEPVAGFGDGEILNNGGVLETVDSFNLLRKGSLVSLSLSVDEATNYLQAPDSQYAFEDTITVKVLPAARSDEASVLQTGMTRITDLFAGGLYLGEDSVVIAQDPDFDETEKTVLSPVDLDFYSESGQATWSKGDPVYVDCDADGSVSTNDVRLNTAFVRGDCSDVYIPGLGKDVVSGSDCDAQEAWNFQQTEFYVTEEYLPYLSDCSYVSPGGETIYDLEHREIALYNDAEDVTVTLSAVDALTNAEVLVNTKNIFKRSLDVAGDAGVAYELQFPLSQLTANDLEPKITIFSPVRDVNYQVEISEGSAFASSHISLQAFGFSGRYRQKLEMELDQVASIPIFNYTVAF